MLRFHLLPSSSTTPESQTYLTTEAETGLTSFVGSGSVVEVSLGLERESQVNRAEQSIADLARIFHHNTCKALFRYFSCLSTICGSIIVVFLEQQG